MRPIERDTACGLGRSPDEQRGPVPAVAHYRTTWARFGSGRRACPRRADPIKTAWAGGKGGLIDQPTVRRAVIAVAPRCVWPGFPT